MGSFLLLPFFSLFDRAACFCVRVPGQGYPTGTVLVKSSRYLSGSYLLQITAPESDSPSEEPAAQQSSPSKASTSEVEEKVEVVEKPATPVPTEPPVVEKKEKVVYSDDEDSEEDEDEDRRELEGRTYSEKGIEVIFSN